MTRQLLNLKTV